ncbi:MAG: MATE family efflux transporter [Suipraeoptans sp.]
MTKNFTRGSISRAIVHFALPLLLGNLLQQLYSVVDTVVVGRFVGYRALASIGASTAVVQLLIGFALGITNGISVETAQALGANEENKVRKSIAIGLILSLSVSLIFSGLGIVSVRPLYSLLQTPNDILDGTIQYSIIMFIGAPVTLLYNYVSAILRAFGDSKTPTIGLLIATVLNILLDLTFVILFGWGIKGVAVATLISQMISGVICGFYALKHIPMMRTKKDDFTWNAEIVSEQLKVGIPMAFHQSVLAIGSLFMQAVLNTLGSMTIAAYTLAVRIDVILYAGLSAFGTTVTTFTAQNYGAGRLDRIKKAVRFTSKVTVCICLFFVLALLAFSPQIMKIFIGNNEVEVIRLGVMYVRINSLFYPLLGIMFVILHAQQGLGRPGIAMCSSLVELAIRPVAALVLAQQFGFAGFRFANAIAWSCSFTMLVVSYAIIMRKLERRL